MEQEKQDQKVNDDPLGLKRNKEPTGDDMLKSGDKILKPSENNPLGLERKKQEEEIKTDEDKGDD